MVLLLKLAKVWSFYYEFLFYRLYFLFFYLALLHYHINSFILIKNIDLTYLEDEEIVSSGYLEAKTGFEKEAISVPIENTGMCYNKLMLMINASFAVNPYF